MLLVFIILFFSSGWWLVSSLFHHPHFGKHYEKCVWIGAIALVWSTNGIVSTYHCSPGKVKICNRTKSFLNSQFWSFQHRPGCYEFYLVSNWATIFFSSNGKFFADYAKIWKDWSRSNKNKFSPIKRKQNIWQKM